MSNGDAVNDANPDKPAPTALVDESNGFRTFLNPIVLIATMILLSIFVLIGAAIVGFDKGVLISMAKIEFARGLITYLFAVVTIGTAVVLVVSALTSTESEAHEKRFQRGKEILSLLLGVFGTIVGFYFGSEVAQKAGAAAATILQVAPIHLSVQTVSQGAEVTLETYVSGGKAPYKYGVGFGADPAEPSEKTEPNGWIRKSVVAPNVQSEQAVLIHVVVSDAEGNRGEQSVPVVVKPIEVAKPSQ
jgi:hypothetical protein